jgi:hypothetical protein
MAERRGVYMFWWGDLREREHKEDPGLDGRIIVKLIFIIWDGGMGWIDEAHIRDKWQAPMSAVFKLGVRKM